MAYFGECPECGKVVAVRDRAHGKWTLARHGYTYFGRRDGRNECKGTGGEPAPASVIYRQAGRLPVEPTQEAHDASRV